MRLLLAIALSGAVLLAGPVLSQAGSPSVPAVGPGPARPAQAASPGQQRAVDDLLAALNAGGGPALDAWILRHALLRPTKGIESWRDWFGRIARTSGGLTLEHIDPPTAGGELRVWVRTGRGDALRRFSLFTDPAGSERLYDFLIAVWPAAYTGDRIRGPATPEQLTELVRDRVAFGAQRDEFSGAALLADRGRPVASAAAGMADAAAGRANTVQTRFHIGSMGKMFTAVAVARQIQEGRLRFDSRLIDVLPDYPDPEAAGSITIAQLLSHTSGISLPYVEPTVPQDSDPERVEDALARIAAHPLAFAPGSRSSYSNEGYTVLGAVLEAVTGQTYYEIVQQTVFDPAGMKHTAFDRPGPLARDTAVGYRYGADDALGVLPREPNTSFLLDRGGPSGGAYSTVEDLTAFLNAFREGRLVSPELVEALLTAEPNGQNRYGKGFILIPAAGKRLVGHSGGGPNSGINADAMIVWETGWSYAVAGNYDAPAAQAVAGDLLAAAVAQPPAIVAQAPVASRTDFPDQAAEAAIAEIIQRHGIVTAGLGVIRDGELVWERYLGEQSAGIAAGPETRFNVASITKTVTAETVLRLADQGRLSLDEPMVAYWLDPDIANDPRRLALTPRTALSHSTGFPNWRFFLPGGRLAFQSGPGERYSYSGEGMEYLARFTERKLGQPFPDLVQEVVLGPVGMTHTSLVARRGEAATSIARPVDEAGRFPGYYCRPEDQGGGCRSEGSYAAADDMVTTVRDYALFLRAVAAAEGYSAEMAADRDRVQTDKGDQAIVDCASPSPNLCPDHQGYGLGFNVLRFGNAVVLEHGGADWSEVSLAYIETPARSGVIIFLNAPNARALAAMPELIEQIDRRSPFLGEYRRWLANARQP